MSSSTEWKIAGNVVKCKHNGKSVTAQIKTDVAAAITKIEGKLNIVCPTKAELIASYSANEPSEPEPASAPTIAPPPPSPTPTTFNYVVQGVENTYSLQDLPRLVEQLLKMNDRQQEVINAQYAILQTRDADVKRLSEEKHVLTTVNASLKEDVTKNTAAIQNTNEIINKMWESLQKIRKENGDDVE